MGTPLMPNLAAVLLRRNVDWLQLSNITLIILSFSVAGIICIGNNVSPILTPLTIVKEEAIREVEEEISFGQFFLALQSSVEQQRKIFRKLFPHGHFKSFELFLHHFMLCPGSIHHVQKGCGKETANPSSAALSLVLSLRLPHLEVA